MNSPRWPETGTIYTETVVHTPPERYAADAPYQLAILEAGGERFTVRIRIQSERDRVQIGDKAIFLTEQDGVPFYSRVPE